MCIFSQHSLIRDPPFSRLDLVTCRNVLIYLSAELQRKLVRCFHYALRPGGFLFLGPSEGSPRSPELFETVDKKNRIFRRKETLTRPMVEFPLSGRSSARASPVRRCPAVAPSSLRRRRATGSAPRSSGWSSRSTPCRRRSSTSAATCSSSPARSPGTCSCPRAPSPPTCSRPCRGSFRTRAADALCAAARTRRRRVLRKDICVEGEDSTCPVHLTVRPMPAVEPEAGLFLVALQEAGAAPDEEAADSGASDVEPARDGAAGERAARHPRRAEDHRRGAGVGQRGAEVLERGAHLHQRGAPVRQRGDADLQGGAQSLNEELETVNAELREKVDELGAANSDLQNLFTATEIATLFLDR